MRTGANDYLTKPFALDELTNVLERSAHPPAPRTWSRASLRERLRTQEGMGNLIGRTPEMEKLYRILSKVAFTTHPVLILGESGTGKELVAFQPVRRDFAFLVPAATPAEMLLRAARGAERTLITEVRLFDVFEGGSLPDGMKSLALEATLQPRDRTLTDAEIEAASQKLIAAVGKATGGTLR